MALPAGAGVDTAALLRELTALAHGVPDPADALDAGRDRPLRPSAAAGPATHRTGPEPRRGVFGRR